MCAICKSCFSVQVNSSSDWMMTKVDGPVQGHYEVKIRVLAFRIFKKFVHFKSKKELDKYSSKEQLMHNGYVAEIEHLDQPDLKKFIKGKNNLTSVCLDEVTDPRNIGSLIRSAASFNIDGLIVKERHFPSESKILYKSASGCVENLNIFQVSNINTTLKYLRDKNFWEIK